jgi:glycosyltransferase involved in cell wall biosynthesis
MPIAVLMPAYNESAALEETLLALREGSEAVGGVTVFLVDDGSDRRIEGAALPTPTLSYRMVVARHATNLGQGAALETARQLALTHPVEGPMAQPPGQGEYVFTAYVTMDSDGQHRVADAFALARTIEEGADVAFGNRFLGDSNVPAVRGLLLRAARWFEQELTGLRLADAHNGLRAFSRAALECLPIRQNRMAHATEIKQRVSEAGPLRIVEVPVSVRYTRESRAKGQHSLGAVNILHDLLHHYLFGEPR